MRICVLIASYEGSISPFKDLDPVMDPTPWLPGHEVTLVPVRKTEAAERVEALARQGYDVFLNLCDGMEDEDTAGVDVVLALERLDLPFTGAGSDCFDPIKARVKEHTRRAGIATPAWVLATGDAEVDRAARTLRFPLIVKHANGYCSIGMTHDSRVEEAGALRREARRMLDAFGAVLIEEFIEGREATILVVEDADRPEQPRVFHPAIYHFPPGETFKHEALKWRRFADGSFAPCEDAPLAAALEALAARSFVQLGFRGYARCDVRIDPDGVPYLLEWNANCGVFYPPYSFGCADTILSWEPEGHRRFLDLLFRAAFARQAEPAHRRRRAPPDLAMRSHAK